MFGHIFNKRCALLKCSLQFCNPLCRLCLNQRQANMKPSFCPHSSKYCANLTFTCTLRDNDDAHKNDFRIIFAAPKSIQATVTLLENLHVILEKTPRDEIRSEVLPLLFNAFESTTIQVQVAQSYFMLFTWTAAIIRKYDF